MITDREALDRIAALCADDWFENGHDDAELVISADDVREVLAEVSPEPDITITPEEAALVVKTFREYGLRHYGATHSLYPHGVLADRLEQRTA